MCTDDTASEFDQVWRQLEGAIRRAVSSRRHDLPHPVEPGLDRQIAALVKLGVVTHQIESELHQLRQIRNMWTHESTGRGGLQLVTPTSEAVKRVRWLIDNVELVPRVEQAMLPAMTCNPQATVFEAVAMMRANDFDALPYRFGSTWFVFTRHQLAHWLELEAETMIGHELVLDVATTVADIAAVVGESRPIGITPREKLSTAVALLREARANHDVYPILLAQSKEGPLILAASDLPRVLALLSPPE